MFASDVIHNADNSSAKLKKKILTDKFIGHLLCVVCALFVCYLCQNYL